MEQPSPAPPRRSLATADFGPGLRLALRVSGVAFVAAFALVLLDVVAGVRLPGALRPALPWVFVAATMAGIYAGARAALLAGEGPEARARAAGS